MKLGDERDELKTDGDLKGVCTVGGECVCVCVCVLQPLDHSHIKHKLKFDLCSSVSYLFLGADTNTLPLTAG